MFIPVGDNVLRRTFPIMPMVLILANVLVFAIQFRVATEHERPRDQREAVLKHMDTWALVPANLKDGELMGVMGHMFMHGGFGHLIGNMFFLWTFSLSLEAAFGRWSYLGFYLLFGVAGGLAHAAADMSSEIPLVGASGAIAGLMGAYMVMFGFASKIKVIWIFFFHPIKLQIPSIAFCGVWFGLQVLNSELDFGGASGVAWSAHIGGFLAGAAVAAVCKSDSDYSVVKDRHGNVSLETHGQAEKIAQEEFDPTMAFDARLKYQIPECCPTCFTPTTEENFNEGLLRCPNEACQKLTFVDYDDHAARAPIT